MHYTLMPLGAAEEDEMVRHKWGRAKDGSSRVFDFCRKCPAQTRWEPLPGARGQNQESRPSEVAEWKKGKPPACTAAK